MTTALTLENVLTPVLAAMGIELVHAALLSESGRKTLRISIDKPGGIKVEDCSQVSRQINAVLEVEFPEMTKCDLEVSSPGLNRPLITPEHYERFTGRQVKISLRKAIDGQRNFKGILLGISHHQITLTTDKETLNFMLEDIEKANLVPEWNQGY